MKKIITGFIISLLLVACSSSQDNISSAITLNKAKEIAQKEIAGDIIRSIKDIDGSNINFEIDILKDNTLHEFEIDGNGKIISHEQEITKNTNITTKNIISSREANDIALKKVGNGKIISSILDTDNGRKVYEVEIIFENKEYDITVDAITKEIISYDIDINK